MLKCKECKLEGRREGRKEALIRLLLTHYSSGLLMVVRSSGQVACPAQPPLKAQLNSTDRWMKHEVLYYSSTSFTSTWLYRFEKNKNKKTFSVCLPATTVLDLHPLTQWSWPLIHVPIVLFQRPPMPFKIEVTIWSSRVFCFTAVPWTRSLVIPSVNRTILYVVLLPPCRLGWDASPLWAWPPPLFTGVKDV